MSEHKKYNPLLGRHEVMVSFESIGSPSKLIASGEVAKKHGVDAEKVVVRNVKNSYGSQTFIIDAFIYDSVETRDKVEPKIRVKKTPGASG